MSPTPPGPPIRSSTSARVREVERIAPGLAQELCLSHEFEFADWRMRTDPRSTEEVYARMDVSGCERCGCEPCFNFVNARHLIYPTDLVDLLEWLGIDPLLESEVVRRRRLRPGWHLYSGWFHLVGELTAGPRENRGERGAIESRYLVKAQHGVALAFSGDRCLAPDGFAGLPVVELEFAVAAPWICNAAEPE